jgi:hypothetical protein
MKKLNNDYARGLWCKSFQESLPYMRISRGLPTAVFNFQSGHGIPTPRGKRPMNGGPC